MSICPYDTRFIKKKRKEIHSCLLKSFLEQWHALSNADNPTKTVTPTLLNPYFILFFHAYSIYLPKNKWHLAEKRVYLSDDSQKTHSFLF